MPVNAGFNALLHAASGMKAKCRALRKARAEDNALKTKKNYILNNFKVMISEPWNFKSADGANVILGKVLRIVSRSCVIFEANHAIRSANFENRILVLTQRHEGLDFGDLENDFYTANIALLFPEVDFNAKEEMLKRNSEFKFIGSLRKINS